MGSTGNVTPDAAIARGPPKRAGVRCLLNSIAQVPRHVHRHQRHLVEEDVDGWFQLCRRSGMDTYPLILIANEPGTCRSLLASE